MLMLLLEKAAPFLEPGLIYGIGAIGLSISMKFLKFPDLTSLGSIMLGGVVCLRVTNASGPLLGIAAGLVCGFLLGAITGSLSQFGGVNEVLAGIIVFTGAFTPGYLLTLGGTIGLDAKTPSFLSSKFTLPGLFFLTLVVFFVAGLGGLVMRTRAGLLLLAMGAPNNFIRARHRSRRAVFFFAVSVANSITALAGALYALRSRQATVEGHLDFLPFALAAVFGGAAALAVLGEIAGAVRNRIVSRPAQGQNSAAEQTSFRRPVGDWSRALWFSALQVSYVAGCLLITVVAGLVGMNSLKDISPVLDLSPDWQHLVTAALLCVAVLWQKRGTET
jgi:putative ABC transport system permease protein